MDQDRTDTKGRILGAAYGLFYRQGFSRVSVDAIAERAGVTKRTVYYHFNSKDDIMTSVIEVQHQHLMAQYATWLDSSSETAGEIVATLFSKLKDWASGTDWLGSGFSRISAELADMRGHPARHAASRHKKALELWLAGQLAAAGVTKADRLARDIMLLIEGSLSLTLIHGETGYIDAAKHAAERLAAEP